MECRLKDICILCPDFGFVSFPVIWFLNFSFIFPCFVFPVVGFRHSRPPLFIATKTVPPTCNKYNVLHLDNQMLYPMFYYSADIGYLQVKLQGQRVALVDTNHDQSFMCLRKLVAAVQMEAVKDV